MRAAVTSGVSAACALCIIAASISVHTSPPSAGQQSATFAAKVESVRVDVLVTDKGQPVRGLGPGDFEVVDNGVPQRVDLVSFEQIPLNVVLAFDMSGSVVGERLDHLRGASRDLLNRLVKGDQAALIAFRDPVTLGAALTPDAAAVRAAVEGEEPDGNTALVDGAYAAMMVGESDAGRALVIVFSDGLDTASWLPPDAVLDVAKRSDVVVYAVSVGRVKSDFLRDLTSLTGGHLYEVEKTANLGSLFASVLEEFRHRYLVSYTPAGVARDGWHRLTVRVKRNVTVKARPGYLAGG
jgi:Ca-activated chloride channel homolog